MCRLSTEAIELEVVDFYILLSEDQRVAPRSVAEEIKLAKLAVWEYIANLRAQHSDSAGGSSFFSSQGILDRLQITIKNLHIRYEDESNHPFATGVVVDQIEVSSLVQARRESMEPEADSEPEPESHSQTPRCAELPSRDMNVTGLSVYWLPDTPAYRAPSLTASDRIRR